MHLVKYLKQTAYAKYSQYISHETLVTGVLKGTDQTFRCLFVENGDFGDYVRAKIFAGAPEILYRRRVLIPGLERVLLGRRDIDLCISVLPRRYESDFRRIPHFITREWVHQTLDTSAPWDKIRKAFHKNPKETFRKIRKYGLTFKTSFDVGDFDHFYNRMFLPHIRSRHGDAARLETYEEMKRYFLRGFLLFVLLEGRAVSGGLCHTEGDTLIFRRIGVLDGSNAYLKIGAQSAVYSSVIGYAKENGIRRVDFMQSRPFLNDGVYYHKNEWGAGLQREESGDACVLFLIPAFSRKIVHIFESNPMIVFNGGELSVLIGWTKAEDPSANEIAQIRARHRSPGLDSFLLLSGGTKPSVRRLRSSEEINISQARGSASP